MDVATVAAEALRDSGGPRLVYWLTLNTHIPIQPEDGSPQRQSPSQSRRGSGTKDILQKGHIKHPVYPALDVGLRDTQYPCLRGQVSVFLKDLFQAAGIQYPIGPMGQLFQSRLMESLLIGSR